MTSLNTQVCLTPQRCPFTEFSPQPGWCSGSGFENYRHEIWDIPRDAQIAQEDSVYSPEVSSLPTSSMS